MSALWISAEIAAATQGRAHGPDFKVKGISIDTRSLMAGDFFVALSAARDGHDFVADALAKGAAGALVSRIPDGVAQDAPLILVEDVQTALEDLGRAGRARMMGQVVAITGSVGKTTSKEMMRAALAPLGRVHASVASYNNHWGVPLTLARMPRETDFAVIEIGMNAPGEIAPLARMARPHLAIVTTVAAAHLEAFGSLEGIAHEKASIYEGLETGGIALVNADVETRAILQDKATACAARVLRFGEAKTAEARLASVEIIEDRTIVSMVFDGETHLFKLNTAGRHLALNAVAVMASVAALGGDVALAALGLSDWQAVTGRGTRERLTLSNRHAHAGEIEMIDDAYNANPASIAAALDVLASAEARRRVAVLGDMLELGAQGPAMHAELADLASIAKIERIHTVGGLMEHLHEALPSDKRGLHCETADEMARALPKTLEEGDIVLLKGSNSVKLARVVDALRNLGQSVEER